MNGITDFTLVTAKTYAEAIDSHTNLQTLYSGHGFEDLQKFLARPILTARNPTAQFPKMLPFATLYTIGNAIKPEMRFYNDHDQLNDALRNNIEDSRHQILFMKGYPSPEWLTSTGALLQIDPEFLRLHMRFREAKEYSSSPSLPSSLENFVRLKVIAVGSREGRKRPLGQIDMEHLREEVQKKQRLYRHYLLIGEDTYRGDSIVREFQILDEKSFLLEQEMTICLSQTDGSWCRKSRQH